MYLNKTTKIRVDTSEEYFIVLHNNKGLKKEQVPSSGLFNRSLTIKNQTVINLHSTLLNDNEFIVTTPNTWNDGEGNLYFDTIINSKKESYHLFYHNLTKEVANSIFKKTYHQEGFAKMRAEVLN